MTRPARPNILWLSFEDTNPFYGCYGDRAAGYYCTNNEKTDYQFDPPLTAWDECGPRAPHASAIGKVRSAAQHSR